MRPGAPARSHRTTKAFSDPPHATFLVFTPKPYRAHTAGNTNAAQVFSDPFHSTSFNSADKIHSAQSAHAIHPFIHPFLFFSSVHSVVPSLFISAFICSFVRAFVLSLMRSFVRFFIRPSIHKFMQHLNLIYVFRCHSFIHPSIHSLS